jgi:DNA-binding NtrC family response regulator
LANGGPVPCSPLDAESDGIASGRRFSADASLTAEAVVTTEVRFLFVDDEELILGALQRVVGRLPIHATFCSDPCQALAIVKEQRIEAVCSDLIMGGLSGLELLQQVRQECPEVVRILASGNVDRVIALRAVNEGRVARIFEKPWNGAALREQLLEVAGEIASRRVAPHADARQALKSFAPLFR